MFDSFNETAVKRKCSREAVLLIAPHGLGSLAEWQRDPREIIVPTTVTLTANRFAPLQVYTRYRIIYAIERRQWVVP